MNTDNADIPQENFQQSNGSTSGTTSDAPPLPPLRNPQLYEWGNANIGDSSSINDQVRCN